jgi:hypothetical protein
MGGTRGWRYPPPPTPPSPQTRTHNPGARGSPSTAAAGPTTRQGPAEDQASGEVGRGRARAGGSRPVLGFLPLPTKRPHTPPPSSTRWRAARLAAGRLGIADGSHRLPLPRSPKGLTRPLQMGRMGRMDPCSASCPRPPPPSSTAHRLPLPAYHAHHACLPTTGPKGQTRPPALRHTPMISLTCARAWAGGSGGGR